MTKPKTPTLTPAEAQVAQLEEAVAAANAETQCLYDRFQFLANKKYGDAAQEAARRAECDQTKFDLNRAQAHECRLRADLAEAKREMLVDEVDPAELEEAKRALDEQQARYTSLLNRKRSVDEQRRAFTATAKSYRASALDYDDSAATIAKRIHGRAESNRRRLAGVAVEGPGVG